MPTLEELKAMQAKGETLTPEQLEQLKAAETAPQPEDGSGTEEFDKERAMDTIRKLREFEKSAKQQLKELEALKKAEADRKKSEMSALELAETELKSLRPEYETLQGQYRSLLTQVGLEKAARGLKLEFASEAAKETAQKLLKAEALGPDLEGIDAEVTRLTKEHAYLFGKITPPSTDASDKGKFSGEVNQAEIKERKQKDYGNF